MKTAVQLRDDRADDLPRCDLLWGSPSAEVPGALGLIALFDAGELVAYRLVHARRVRVFVFRTLAARDPSETLVPGVRPAVHLLLELRTAGRARLLSRLLKQLALSGATPSALKDDFFWRAGVALSGRAIGASILEDLSKRALSHRSHPGARAAPPRPRGTSSERTEYWLDGASRVDGDWPTAPSRTQYRLAAEPRP